MRILFDQGTPVQIRNSLQEHDVRTARQQGWSRLSNGDLLRAAEDAGFALLLTTDKKMGAEVNFSGRRIAVVALGNGLWPNVKPRLAEVITAVRAAKPGTFSVVDIPSC